MKFINDSIWFWKYSKKFTGMKGLKLFKEGFKPYIKFIKLQNEVL